jgi:hypothetical protein
VPHLSVPERVARGKAARAEVPRSRQAEFEPAPDRADPIDLLEAQAETRLPDLVPIRYGRMLVSPFTFYRGAAKIMASDLAATPRSGLTVQCCGDAHLSNFGVFASPERRLVFDINDFDETLPGPWEWDVKRLSASMVIAARDNGFGAKAQERIVLETVGQYRTAMAEFAGMNNLDVWYSRFDAESALEQFGSEVKAKQVKRAEKQLAKARTKDSLTAFSKLTESVDGHVPATATRSTARSSNSPRLTRSRTSAITRSSRAPSSQAGSPPKPACDRMPEDAARPLRPVSTPSLPGDEEAGMRGQFDDTAMIISSGEGLQVTGPAEWDPDEFGAVIRVRVWQEGTVATGVSAYTPSSATSWTATLITLSGTLQPGVADARARATVSLDNGHTEPYSWPDTVELVS